MQFQVPQFIEIEDKIVGPLTFKQFLFLIGGGGGAFIFYQLPIFSGLKFFLVILSIAIGAAFAFFKMNNKTLLSILEDMVTFYLGKKLYLWKKIPKQPKSKASNLPSEQEDQGMNFGLPALSESKLKELTWGLDVQTKSKDL